MQVDIDEAYVQQHLRSIIIHSLDNFNYKNAEFASERLLAIDPTNLEYVYLYCLSLYRQERFKSVYSKLVDVIDINDHLGCGFIFAKLCLQLKRYKEGIFQLLKISHLYNEAAIYQFNENAEHDKTNAENTPISDSNHHNPAFFTTPQLRYNYEFHRSIYPDLSSVYHLLGDLYKAINDTKNSALNYSFCLKYNQFNFEAFQELCKLGVNVKVKSIYKSNSNFNSQLNQNVNYAINKTSRDPEEFGVNISEDDIASANNNNITNPFSSSTTPVHNSGTKPFAGDEPIDSISTPRVKPLAVPDAPLRKTNFINNGSNERHDFPKPNFPIHANITPTAPNIIDTNNRKGPSKRESTYSKITSRLISQPKVMETGEAISKNKRPASVMRGPLKRNNSIGQGSDSSGSSGASSNNVLVNKGIDTSDQYLLRLYIIFAKSFKCMTKFDCYKAIRILEDLPSNEKETPWVLSKLGRLHYEIVNYKQSEFFFIKVRKLDRTRLEDMEYYSTLLWHLHKRVELTYLANELHDLDKNSAITWCVIGNLFSLMREPDESIKCFSKAIKLDENFTYAYTLKGHEYFGNDNYEMALENFRISLLIDSRHYNALYGIGMVYINLGDYQKADYHFRKAVSINPINIILICCTGMVLEKMGKKSLALKQYELANKLQPLSALPIFKRAQLLFSMQQFDQSLKSFEQVKELAPNEASVHFLLGQLYNIQNNKFKAIREFTIALNLDPKGNYLIREAMESLNQK